MSRKRLSTAQLQHYLCPILRTNTSKRLFNTLPSRRPRCPSLVPLHTIARCLQERNSTTSARHSDERIDQDKDASGGLVNEPAKYHGENKTKNGGKHAYRGVRVGRRPPPNAPDSMKVLPTNEVEDKLTKIAEVTAKLQNAMQPLYVLLRDRGIKPDVRHYKAIIHSNSDPEHGSSITVRSLLAEMEEHNVPLDASPLRAALLALAVHPDFILRQDVLRMLRSRWITLSEDDWHHVVAGLIREHQFELALDHLAHMGRKHIVVKDWLHSLLVYNLLEFNEFDLVRELMEARLNQGHGMKTEFWNNVLHAASRARHHGLTSFIWWKIVELKNSHPERIVCERVLEVAARNKDTRLQAAVEAILRHNGAKPRYKDYLGLTRGHLEDGDLFAALDVCIGIDRHVRMRCYRYIRAYCLTHEVHPLKIWNRLKDLKELGHTIPSESAMLVVDLCEKAAARDPFIVDDGVRIYKELYALCGKNPSLGVFNSLLGMSRTGRNAQAAAFFVKEMAKLGVAPTGETFEHLIFLCVKTGNFQSAYLYANDLSKRGFKVRNQTRKDMIRLCEESKNRDEWAAKMCEENKRQFYSLTDKQREKHKRDRDKYKARRREKRRAQSIAEAKEEEGWEDYEPSLTTPEDLEAKSEKLNTATAEAKDGSETERQS
ncbi:pentatricopeptide repeat protein [Aspergillus mulundensis]|uniref:Pentatricopeptide repeat protein n=1 Tax=Aspergillus mulundensis TaxID=1810919 RepID=A0A3D8SVY2_9EURO|nr:Uncharacterized protein DSM5745_02209 [Aspergillus mulundensis]RDW90434.1 Uncharacterized protein DSM5745_02209 [Aspergillus mulundensis]